MEHLLQPVSDTTLSWMENLMNNWVFYLSIGLLSLELIRYVLFKKMNWKLAGDTVSNSLVFFAYLAISYTVFYGIFGVAFYWIHQFAVFDIETTWVSIITCILLADLLYYWEHRFTHRVGAAWATHEVHHSSPNMNISVAYRFGPLDDVWALAFYLPLPLIGFDPLVAFFTTAFVLQFQTFLHTETVGKFPHVIEAIFNTPSHHRVHHGSNPQYIDKNYAGVLIIWDRMFGTFAEEVEPVTYGLTKQINSVNPVVIFFHGIYDLGRKIAHTPGGMNKLRRLIMPPDWEPQEKDRGSSTMPAE